MCNFRGIDYQDFFISFIFSYLSNYAARAMQTIQLVRSYIFPQRCKCTARCNEVAWRAQNLRAIRAVRVISREWHAASTGILVAVLRCEELRLNIICNGTRHILYLSHWNAMPDLVVNGFYTSFSQKYNKQLKHYIF